MTALLQLQGVHKRFGRTEVLRGVDLSLDEREVVCLIGPSGSGKPTLLRCVNALEPIHAGTIQDVNRLRRDVGIVFQSFNLFPHMTVLRNVILAPCEVLGLRRPQAVARARPLLERIGMWDKRDEYPDGCRAASSSVLRSSWRWRCSPSCCSWTRSRARWTPNWSPRFCRSCASWRRKA